MSRDFYSDESIATRIKSPVELVVSTYRKLGLTKVPGIPDFNEVSARLGQRLLSPPTVAGWTYGRAWITPSLLMERGNFALDLAFPEIAFIAYDRYAAVGTDEIRAVHERIRAGMDINTATKPAGRGGMTAEATAMSNLMVDRDEDFNTRYAAYRGWQMAIERVKPIERTLPRLELARMVAEANLTTPSAVVDYFERRFLSVALDAASRQKMADFLMRELGTSDIRAAKSFSEEALRQLLHVLLSRPEYQLG